MNNLTLPTQNTPKLRVAMATKFPYTEAEGHFGLLQVARNLCNALARRTDIELHVVSGTDKTRHIEHKQVEKYSITYLPYPPDPIYYGTFYIMAALAMKRELLRIKPDIVHCQAIAETPMASLLARVPFVTTLHGISAYESHTAHSLKIRLAYWVQSIVEAWYVKRLPHVVVLSPYISRYVSARNPTAKFYSVPNPIDPTFFDADTRHARRAPDSILMIGSITFRKAHDLMIEALAQLVQEFNDVRLTVIGNEVDKVFAQSIKQRIKDKGLCRNVNWLGPVSQNRLIEEMQVHQIVCLPSREETLPMSLAQAMIMGNICVASNAGGIPEMIQHNQNGFLFTSGDAIELYKTLSAVIKLPANELDAMRQRNRAFAQKAFCAESVAEQTVRVYRNILSGV